MPALAIEHPEICLAQGCTSHCTNSSTKWCSFHEGQQGRGLKIYKRLTEKAKLLRAEQDLQSKLHIIAVCDNAVQLREWHTLAEIQWRLKNRALSARIRHHNQFYAGGDEAHVTFLETLKNEMQILETAMEAYENRLYHLLTADAKWLQDGQEDADCSHPSSQDSPDDQSDQSLPYVPGDDSKSDASACPVRDEELEDIDPEAARRKYLIAYLKSYLDVKTIWPDGDAARAANRFAAMCNIFRHIVARTPSLLVRARARSFPDVQTFLEAGDLSLSELEKLRKKLRFGKSNAVGPRTRRNAIADMFQDREDVVQADGTELGKIDLLGGSVYQQANNQALPLSGWELLHDFMPCEGCALSACRSFEEWSNIRRLSIIGKFPWWSGPTVTSSHDLLRVLGIVLCVDNSKDLRSTGWVKHRGPSDEWMRRYEDVVQRPFAFLKISLHDPLALSYIQALRSAFPAGTFVRNSTTRTHLYESTPRLWPARTRASYSDDVRFVPWHDGCWATDVMDAFNYDSPERIRLGSVFKDVYEVLVLDDQTLPFRDYAQRIVDEGSQKVWYYFLFRLVRILLGGEMGISPHSVFVNAVAAAIKREEVGLYEKEKRHVLPAWPGESAPSRIVPPSDTWRWAVEPTITEKKRKNKGKKKRAIST